MDTVLRYDVIQQLDTGEEFDMVFINADRRRGTGGQIMRVEGWRKVKGTEPLQNLPGEYQRTPTKRPRNPSHLEHQTINIYNPNNPGAHAVKVHWRLIQFFNGKRVLQ